MNHSASVLQVSHVSKSFEGRPVLKDVHCELRAGQIVALVGANGVGKTTLLRCLAGLIRPDSGRIMVTRNASAAPPAAWFSSLIRRVACKCQSRHRTIDTARVDASGFVNGYHLNCANGVVDRRLVGFVSHENQLYPHLTMQENLVFAARICGVQAPIPHVRALLTAWGLQKAADRLPARLSQGTRQRYAIARALVYHPPIVLLDEPFVNLDQQGRGWLIDLLRGLRRRDRVILFTSHDLSLVQNNADRVIELYAGAIREQVANGRERNSYATEPLADPCGALAW